MDVELITDNMPTRDLLISRNDRLHMSQEVFLSTCRSAKGGQHLSRHHIAAENKAEGAMPLVLEFSPLDVTWGQR
jgi:hypothetical protein